MGKRGITLVILVLSGILVLSIMPMNSSAFPYRIRGYLKDQNGVPIPHATLELSGEVFNVSSGQTEIGTSYFPDATSGTGFFDISFGVDEPGGLSSGDTATLSYSYGDLEAQSSFVIAGLERWENLTTEGKSSPLDVLFSPVGVAIIVIILFVLIVAGYWYSTTGKEEEEITEEAKSKVGRRRR
jgi:hypothetical protein